jgi:hypothetical protein
VRIILVELTCSVMERLVMSRLGNVRRFLSGRRGVIEFYEAQWHGRIFPYEKLRIRVDCFRDHCEIVGQRLEMNETGDWQPSETLTRHATLSEWEQLSELLDPGFWNQPSNVHGPGVLDGESWKIIGYKRGNYHEVYRDSGNLTETVVDFGTRLVRLAELPRFEDTK